MHVSSRKESSPLSFVLPFHRLSNDRRRQPDDRVMLFAPDGSFDERATAAFDLIDSDIKSRMGNPAFAIYDTDDIAQQRPLYIMCQELIAQGGMGKIWKAYDLKLGRLVAIKTDMQGFESAGICITKEARVTANVRSRHVVNVFGLITLQDNTGNSVNGMVMEYLDPTEYTNIGEILNNNGPRTHGRSTTFLVELIGNIHTALQNIKNAQIKKSAASQDHSVISLDSYEPDSTYVCVRHRDLKPWNMMTHNSTGHVICLDWGLHMIKLPQQAKKTEVEELVMGSPKYLSDNQLQGIYDFDQDETWLLAEMMFEYLTGEHVYAELIVMTRQEQARTGADFPTCYSSVFLDGERRHNALERALLSQSQSLGTFKDVIASGLADFNHRPNPNDFYNSLSAL